MNRAEHRRFFKKYRKELQLGTWQQWNATITKQKPYINYAKRMVLK